MLYRRIAFLLNRHLHSNPRSRPENVEFDIQSILLKHLEQHRYPEFRRVLLSILPINLSMLPPIIHNCRSPRPLGYIFDLVVCAKIPSVDTINHLILGRAIKLRHVFLVRRIIESTRHPPAPLLASAFEFLLCFQHKSKRNEIHPSKPLRSIFISLDRKRLNDALKILIARIQAKLRHNAWNIDSSHVLIKTVRYFDQTVIDLDVQCLLIGQFLNIDTTLLIKFLKMPCFRNEVVIGAINHHLRIRRFHFAESQVMSTENRETMLSKQVAPPQFFAQAVLILLRRLESLCNSISTQGPSSARSFLLRTLRSFIHETDLKPMFEYLSCLDSAGVVLYESELYVLIHGLTIIRNRFDLAYDIITKQKGSPRIYRVFIQSSSLLCPKYTFPVYRLMVEKRIKPSKALLNHMAANFARSKKLSTTNATHLMVRLLREFKRLNYFGGRITAAALIKVAVLRGERISTERWRWALSVVRLWLSKKSMAHISLIAKRRYKRIMTVVTFSRKYKHEVTKFTRIKLRTLRCMSSQKPKGPSPMK